MAWQAEVIGIDLRRLVFPGETWASTNKTRRYGRSHRGQRLIAKVPHGHCFSRLGLNLDFPTIAFQWAVKARDPAESRASRGTT